MSKKVFIYNILILLVSILICSCSILHRDTFTNNSLELHFIDVGQGDSILIHFKEKNLLIDSGPKESTKTLINHLNRYDVKKINYLIATHPHDDHIGNMAFIIKKYKIGAFYSPKIEATGKIYENMIDSLKNKNLKINILNENTDSIKLDKDITLKVLSPKENGYDDKSNLNNYSAVFLLKYKNTSFLLTGDAEKEAEEYIISKNKNIKADVLKLGHHGSSTSTTEAFLKAVSPSVAIISCGKDNCYGHPHGSVLKLLNKYKIKTFRTDKDGTIKIISNGSKIKISKSKEQSG